MCAERVEECAPTMSARDALVGVGILGEKMQLLSGEVTARIEVTSGGDIFEKMSALHAELVAMAQAKPIEATVIESPAEIGLTDGKAEQTAEIHDEEPAL